MTRALLIVVAMILGTTSFAGSGPDYVRYRENATSARLEVAIRSFALPSGQSVDLIGVVHIADAAYYQALNDRFDRYDSVLFELVGDPSHLTQRASATGDQATLPSGGAVSTIQGTAAKHLDLEFQLDAIDYTKKNMVHADASAAEFARMQEERGENFLTLFGRAMKAQMIADMTGQSRIRNEFDTFGLIRILMSPDSALEFKKALARDLARMEAVTEMMEGKEGSAILAGRNEVVIDKMKEVLADRKQRRIAVFYGGAHMPGIEAALLEDFKGTLTGTEWVPAWNMPAKRKPAAEPAAGQPAQDTARG